MQEVASRGFVSQELRVHLVHNIPPGGDEKQQSRQGYAAWQGRVPGRAKFWLNTDNISRHGEGREQHLSGMSTSSGCTSACLFDTNKVVGRKKPNNLLLELK